MALLASYLIGIFDLPVHQRNVQRDKESQCVAAYGPEDEHTYVCDGDDALHLQEILVSTYSTDPISYIAPGR